MGNWGSAKRRFYGECYLIDAYNTIPILRAEQDSEARILILKWNDNLTMMKNPSKNISEWYAKNAFKKFMLKYFK